MSRSPGGLLLRIDIPVRGTDEDGNAGEEYTTEYYGSSAIYCMQPVSEEVARDQLGTRDRRPMRTGGIPTPVATRGSFRRWSRRPVLSTKVSHRKSRPKTPPLSTKVSRIEHYFRRAT